MAGGERSATHAARGLVLIAATLVLAAPAWAAAEPASAVAQDAAPRGPAAEAAGLRRELDEARARIADQGRRLADQERRLALLEQRLSGVAQNAQAARDEALALREAAPTGPRAAVGTVGAAPADQDRAPAVAVLAERGSVVTRRGQLVGELGIDYTRSDRNRAVFRGVELLESILIGVFDVNESRQDIVTGSAALRYGLTNRLEIGGRVPFIYRSDKSIVAPIAGSTNDDAARTIDSSVKGSSIGDVELSARYQLNDGGPNIPFLIANMQATLPTGRSAFDVRRDENGSAQEVATGAGFLGLSPSITAILPTEPAVLFGTVGYTYNLPKNVDTRIPPVQIDRVDPGDAINLSAGIGLALNDRTSLSLGYAHSWAFGTTTWTRLLDEQTQEPVGETIKTRSRDLQVGRFLFGVTQRFAERINVNWSVEVGATQDAPDVRTLLRVPIAF
jgi:hypothetical protein